jgi:pimeloyl-ACP methyl ester carboxylesterase
MPVSRQDPPPDLPGVEHRYVTTPDDVRIHIAEAGPGDGRAIMLLHGFPQHWWEWRRLIGPLAGDGYRVLAPDLRGAGWSDAPRGLYTKGAMAEDLAAVLDQLGIEQTWIAAHDWGGLAGSILMLSHPQRVAGFAGLNTAMPWVKIDGAGLRHTPAFSYQYPLAAPGIGPWLIGRRGQRYLHWLCGWLGGGYRWSAADTEIYLSRWRDPARAHAGSRWYGTFQTSELWRWARGEYAHHHVDVPMRWLTGLRDPVITPVMHHGYEDHASDIAFEHVPDVGHWIIEEAHDLVLEHLRSCLREAR